MAGFNKIYGRPGSPKKPLLKQLGLWRTVMQLENCFITAAAKGWRNSFVNRPYQRSEFQVY